MLEHEKKILLTKEEFARLHLWAPEDSKVSIQKNYYFDGDDFQWNRNGVTLRIREKEGKYTATVKEHCHCFPEKSVETSMLVQNEKDCRLFENRKVWLQGCLITQRVTVMIEDNVEVVIDENHYLDTTDYELEIEYIPGDKSKETMKKLLEELAANVFDGCDYDSLLERSKHSESKSARFFARLNRLRGERGKCQ